MPDIIMSDDLKKKMLGCLEKDNLSVSSEENTYLLFNQMEIEVGGDSIIFKKDGVPVGSIKTNNIQTGETIYLVGVIGFIKANI